MTAKILFVPTNRNEIEHFSLVAPKLEENQKVEIVGIAIDGEKEELIRDKKIPYENIVEYKTKNLIDIVIKENPGVIITDDQNPITRAFILAANHMHVPVLIIDDGIVITRPKSEKTPLKILPFKILRAMRDWKGVLYRFSFVFRTLNAVNGLPISIIKTMDELFKFTFNSLIPSSGLNFKLAVFGLPAKDAYVKMGIDQNKIFITGLPVIDTVLQKKFNRNSILQKFGIIPGKNIIVLATDPFVEGYLWKEEEREKFIEYIIDSVSRIPDTQLIIKIHPRESVESYEKILRKIGKKIPIYHIVDVHELLYVSNLLITIGSTVGLEAMMLGKPVITLNFINASRYVPYSESAAAVGIHEKKDLPLAIEDCLYNKDVRKKLAEKQKEFIERHVYLDGRASERIAELIMRMIEESRKANASLQVPQKG